MIDTAHNYGLKRLKSKTAKDAIIQKLAHDFNLTAIIAEAYYHQVAGYFNEHANRFPPEKSPTKALRPTSLWKNTFA